ncbi:MAG: L,D-transpeptidase family protein [Verrucomicrobia bacterium]|nr:L,D-transpeptidase family protein [Cytophagales bacterium]
MVNFFYPQRLLSFSAGVIVVFLVITTSNGVFSKKSKSSPQISYLLEQLSATGHISFALTDRLVEAELMPETKDFYKQNDFGLVWLTPDQALPQTDSLIFALKNAHREGLDSNTYYLSEITRLHKETFGNYLKIYDFEKLTRLDLLLTDAYLLYARHLYTGRANPSKLDTAWIAKLRQKDFIPYLQQAITANRIRKSLADLLPKHTQYAQLRSQLSIYQDIVKKNGWANFSVANAIKLKQGDTDSIFASLKKHLMLTKDMPSDTLLEPVFDEKLVRAIKKFQYRNGLEVTGKLDKTTLVALNIPVLQQMQTLMLNMERYKWLPENLGDRFILVNIPAFDLNVYDNYDCKVMDMRVIVGEVRKQTPIFSDTLDHLIFSPEWSVPLSIARKEMLPMLKRGVSLEAQGIKVYKNWAYKAKPIDTEEIDWVKVKENNFNYRLVARSGDSNPLGYIMFNFPNPMHIYLHDTPYDGLFQVQRRDLSHGCIRVQYPAHLAGFVMESDINWTRNRVVECMHQYSPMTVKIPGKKVFIHLVYLTTWVNENGKVCFREDIYKHDARQWQAIENAGRKAKTQLLAVKKN